EQPIGASGLTRTAVLLKRYSIRGADLAIAPALRATKQDPYQQWGALVDLLGVQASITAGLSLLFVLVLWAGFAVAPIAAACALAAFHLQPVIALSAGRLRPRGLWSAALFRSPIAVVGALRLLLADRSKRNRPQIESLRPVYSEL